MSAPAAKAGATIATPNLMHIDKPPTVSGPLAASTSPVSLPWLKQQGPHTLGCLEALGQAFGVESTDPGAWEAVAQRGLTGRQVIGAGGTFGFTLPQLEKLLGVKKIVESVQLDAAPSARILRIFWVMQVAQRVEGGLPLARSYMSRQWPDGKTTLEKCASDQGALYVLQQLARSWNGRLG